MARYGMVVDLKKCVGCNACAVACKSEHNAPTGILLTAVLEKEMGKFPDANRVFIPVLCNHCENATCVDVCPTKATHQRDDGLVMIDYDTCIGCMACIEHCPYDVRQLVTDDRALYSDGKTAFQRPVHQPIPKDVADWRRQAIGIVHVPCYRPDSAPYLGAVGTEYLNRGILIVVIDAETIVG